MPELQGHAVDCGDCPYLPGRRFHAFVVADPHLQGVSYRRLLDLRFRRTGDEFYAPMCTDCTECRPIRIDVAQFTPRRDQRRCQARNADLQVEWRQRGLDDERLHLFRRYQAAIHDDHGLGDPGQFLVADGGIDGGELQARDDLGRLLAVSCCDRFDDALSSVYCYYDPDQPRRSLGTFMVLNEIARARQLGLDWLYLGYHVADCRKMAYKARFNPHQILVDGRWLSRDAQA